jgi:23S rRNA G2445 N2-methylase RlmL
MSKVILEFDAVEDQDDIQSALNGYKWKMAMWDLDQEFRKTTKYGESHIKHDGTGACSVEDAVAERYREMIREILSGYGLILDL